MKAITILQPWASLIACGAKKIETRSWPTKYRGPIAIHAGASWKKYQLETIKKEPFFPCLWYNEAMRPVPLGGNEIPLPLGQIIAMADLIDCQEMTMDKIVAWRDVYGKNEIAFGDFQPGRYAWALDNVRQITPVPAKGQQRLWEW